MTNRKFYETTITLKLLSEEPIPHGMYLANVLEQANSGDLVLSNERRTSTTLNGEQTANSLYEAGSEPGFFQLDDDGNDNEN